MVRNCWPMGIIWRVFPDDDGHVRKLEVSIMKDGTFTSYIRPVVEVVLLVKQ